MIDLSTLGGHYSAGQSINQSNQIVGASTILGTPPDNDGLMRAFVYSGGRISTLNGLAQIRSSAFGINGSGDITGSADIGPAGTTRTFLYSQGRAQDLGILTGGSYSVGRAINDVGQGAGYADIRKNVDHAFIYSGERMTDLGTLPGGSFSQAYSINKIGEVVGVSGTADAGRHAFLFRSGTMEDLNTLLVNGDGWVLDSAMGINDKHQIVGQGYFRTQPHAFVLNPSEALPTEPGQQRPNISAVVSSGDFKAGISFSGLASIFGSNLSDAEYRAPSLPLPNKLGNTEVFLCSLVAARNVEASACVSVGIVYAGKTQINVLLPDSLPQSQAFSGGTTAVFTVRVSGIVDVDSYNATAKYYQLSNPAPRVFWMGYDCFIDPRYQDWGKACGLSLDKGTFYRADRGAVTDISGRLVTSANPAKLGQYYTIWLTGLGVVQSGQLRNPVSVGFSNIPVYGYSGDTNFAGPPDYAGRSPQFPGLYQVNFKMPTSIATGGPNGYPPMFPCGDYNWEISISIAAGGPGFGGWQYGNLIQIPISVKTGDVSCAVK